MGLMDREWYGADLAQRLRRRRGRAALRATIKTAVAFAAIVLAALALLPPVLTSRCNSSAWRTTPARCWQLSSLALRKRVSANMAASNGLPVGILRGRE